MSMTTSEPPPPPALASVDHALRLLLLLGDRPELRVTEAAARLGVAASTAHRLLTTLAARGFVTQDRISKVYRVGPALIEIGVHSTSSIDLRAAGEPHLKVLSQRISETVNLLVRQGDCVRFVAGFEADQQVRTQVLTGALLPAYATSGGKVLLAELSREELRALYPRGLRRLTQRTRTFTQLMAELPLVMMRGFAVNDQESSDGLSAIAVPLRARDGRAIAAVAMSAPSARLSAERMRELVVELRACASAIRGDLAR